MSNVKGMAIALACLISMPALAEDTLDQLHVVMAALADAKLAVTQCPQYKINGIEFTLWAGKEKLSAKDMESSRMVLFTLLRTNSMLEAQKEAGQNNSERCDSWWRIYGPDGHEHPNLLLRL